MPRVFMHSHFVNDDETKLKIAWNYPPTVTFGEAVFAVPLIEAYQKYPTPIAYGYETVNNGMSKIIREAHGKYFYALDFKSFDETVPTWLIRIVFDILIFSTNFGKYRNAGVPDARRMHAMFNTIIDYFINTKIQLYSGKLFLKRGGIASGRYFTQLIQSIINCILIFWINFNILGKSPEYIKVLGNVSIFSTDSFLKLHEAQDLLKLVGMRLNLEKSACSTNIHDLTFSGFSSMRLDESYCIPIETDTRWTLKKKRNRNKKT